MKTTTKRAFGGRALRGALAAGLAASLALAGASAAFADAAVNPKSTTMKLRIESTQVTATVPTDVAIGVNGDGTFVAPDNVKIVNGSVFAVHVSKVKATVSQTNAFNLVGKDAFAGADAPETLWMSVKPKDGTDEIDLSEAVAAAKDTAAGQWNMGYADAGAATDELPLEFAGAVNKTALVSSADTAVEALSLQWTIAAGAAAAPSA